MTVLLLLLFCSLVLVAGSIVLFVASARQGDCHEADRLCLLPLEDDDVTDASLGQASTAGDPPALGATETTSAEARNVQ